MSKFSQLIHRLFTASPQPDVSKEIASLQGDLRQVMADISFLSRDAKDHADKTRSLLESYRARSQPRKDGKFGSKESAGSTNERKLVEHPTHQQIEQMGRSQGLSK